MSLVFYKNINSCLAGHEKSDLAFVISLFLIVYVNYETLTKGDERKLPTIILSLSNPKPSQRRQVVHRRATRRNETRLIPLYNE